MEGRAAVAGTTTAKPPAPTATAKARFVRVTPMKARRVVDLIRGLSAREAQAVLTFAPQAASEPVSKVLASAVANAENNERLDPETLWVREAFVDEGPTAKRFRPRAQGRAFRIRKRSSHITVVLEARPTQAPPRRRRPAAASGSTTARGTAARSTASTGTKSSSTATAATAKGRTR